MANVVEIVIRGIDKTKEGFTSPINNLSDLGKAVDKVAPFFVALAVTAEAAFVAMAVHAIETADEMGKFAQKAGVTTEAFSSLAYAASLSNVSSQELSKGFKDLSKTIAEASVFGSEMWKTFNQVGLSARDANGNLITSEAALLKIADLFADTADGATKTALAVKFFGRAGQDMIPFLNEGAKGIKEMQEEALILHQVFSDQVSKSAKEFDDDLRKLKLALQGIVNGVVSEFLPAVAKITTAFVEWIKTSGVLEGAINSLIDVFKAIRYVIELVMNAGEALWDIFKGIAEGVADVFVLVKDMIQDLARAAGSAFAAVEAFFKGQWTNAKNMAKESLDGLKTDFTVWKNQIITIGADTAKGFTGAFALLAKGPVAPDLFQGQTPEMYGPPPPPKPGLISSPDFGSYMANNPLPSGFTMQAYQLDQSMIQKTKEALLAANATKISLGDQQKAQLAINLGAEQQAFDKRMEQITNLRLEDGENYGLVEQAYAEHSARMQKITKDMAKQVTGSHLAMLDSVGSILGSFASIAQQFGKKGFLAYQALAIGQAIISTAAGAARAFMDFPWPASAFVAAAVSAAGLAQVATIIAQKPPQAHAGATMIPEEATYLLQGGERVLAPEQNQDLTEFLKGNSASSNVVLMIDGYSFGQVLGRLSRDGRLQIDERAIVAA